MKRENWERKEKDRKKERKLGEIGRKVERELQIDREDKESILHCF